MPRLVRRRPLLERLRDHLDPWDVLLQLAEWANDDTINEWLQTWALQIGVGLNVLFIIAKLAAKPSLRSARDDVFGDSESRGGPGWFGWLAAFLVPLLTGLCIANTVFTFYRKRHYRLFEQPVEESPATPSARLVRVDSSPMSSSPLRYLQQALSEATSGAKAHVDPEREVWEVSMWDPQPFNLTLFTLFSPGHLAFYYAMLPPAALDPNPSVKVAMAFIFGVMLSVQLGALRTFFSQQSKDAVLVHGEVMNEYDTKFVRPNLNRPVRDVGVQTRESALTPRGTKTREVDVYTPTTIIKRGFRTNPNPNYARQYDPDNLSAEMSSSRRTSDVGVGNQLSNVSTPPLPTPSNAYARTNGYTNSAYSRPSTSGQDFSSPLKPHHERLRERTPIRGDGGSLGVYSHAASPLRKAASSNHLASRESSTQTGRPTSPLKRTSTPGINGSLAGASARRRETGRF
ncbi:uncharacterized protein LTR77_007771 [Saxophila tyrrhenica]|uniref:Meiotically up-regulated gene 154 protein n=1 Tax=Saxophila tyrrhenica TaxID=1690608 RepID=A0AAV9P2X4_9PEZI|nr:hypothetical protein LTR77_007771 [Saxophila tyrrhenica]